MVSFTVRRLSSNADMPDYGSLCSLQRRWQTALDPAASLANIGGVYFLLPYFRPIRVFPESFEEPSITNVQIELGVYRYLIQLTA
jgi:hypothetical protein